MVSCSLCLPPPRLRFVTIGSRIVCCCCYCSYCAITYKVEEDGERFRRAVDLAYDVLARRAKADLVPVLALRKLLQVVSGHTW